MCRYDKAGRIAKEREFNRSGHKLHSGKHIKINLSLLVYLVESNLLQF
jgi:hypothetical protein